MTIGDMGGRDTSIGDMAGQGYRSGDMGQEDMGTQL